MLILLPFTPINANIEIKKIRQYLTKYFKNAYNNPQAINYPQNYHLYPQKGFLPLNPLLNHKNKPTLIIYFQMDFDKTDKPIPPTNQSKFNEHLMYPDSAFDRLLFQSQRQNKIWTFDSEANSRSLFQYDQESAQNLNYLHKKMEENPKVDNLSGRSSQEGGVDCYILKQKKLLSTKNSPRLLTRIAIKFLPLQKFAHIPELKGKMQKICKFWEQWHLSERRNVFLLTHLLKPLEEGEQLSRQEAKQARKALGVILRRHTIEMLQDRKCQIKERRIDYLRCSKIYALRCRHRQLIRRNESR